MIKMGSLSVVLRTKKKLSLMKSTQSITRTLVNYMMDIVSIDKVGVIEDFNTGAIFTKK